MSGKSCKSAVGQVAGSGPFSFLNANMIEVAHCFPNQCVLGMENRALFLNLTHALAKKYELVDSLGRVKELKASGPVAPGTRGRKPALAGRVGLFFCTACATGSDLRARHALDCLPLEWWGARTWHCTILKCFVHSFSQRECQGLSMTRIIARRAVREVDKILLITPGCRWRLRPQTPTPFSLRGFL